jgi:hypothetical protein
VLRCLLVSSKSVAHARFAPLYVKTLQSRPISVVAELRCISSVSVIWLLTAANLQQQLKFTIADAQRCSATALHDSAPAARAAPTMERLCDYHVMHSTNFRYFTLPQQAVLGLLSAAVRSLLNSCVLLCDVLHLHCKQQSQDAVRVQLLRGAR